MARVCHLVGPGGFEPPTSTMSRPIGRTKARVDTRKLAAKDGLCKAFAAIFSRCLYVIEDVEAECWRERIAIVRFPESRRPLRFRWVVSGSLSHQSGRRKYRACGRQKRETA